ncbi:thiamine pyrophosphate-binding protein [Altererythrobacter arenosus]|uniref:Thiamine pyrophosphate-binding protein n=1 Tax=Altererythrobacter arenosus TaxID=3032592 RepID=A0ABY8FWB7_9SPHN|nr:thiamine pyrophosphate-binding protein [Altererythrobacter sp. CAU 1644]WFL76324.1 thiamine pyrophosphate-binding protein [Altererythrobacter sp. CAU 1644]
MTGAEAIAGILSAQGVRTVFALAGASHTHLLDQLELGGFAIVPSRHEAGTVGAADGYARALADQRPMRPGVGLIVSEQGIANAVGGLAVAYALGSPVVVLAAIPPAGFVEPANLIASAQLDIVRPVSKWARIARVRAELGDLVREAVLASISDRPGPAVLFIPQDLFREEGPACNHEPIEATPSEPDEAQIEHAASLLNEAERPLAISGFGAFRGRTGEGLQRLAALGVPVLGNGSGRGLVPEDGERGWSWPYAQHLACEADCVIVVGEVLTQRLGFGLPPRFSPKAKFIQIDVDPTAFHRNRPTDAPIAGDPARAIDGLLSRLRRSWDASWLAKGLAEKDGLMASLAKAEGAAIHPLALGEAVQAHLGEHTILVGDGADIQNWMYGALKVRRGGGFIDHFPLGAMGSGTALAVGAAAAMKEGALASGNPPAGVVLVTGDGAIGFHPGELHAAALAGLDLKVIVGNDGAWGTERHGQLSAIGRTVNTDLGGAAYDKVAQGFGLSAARCDHRAELEEAVEKLFGMRGPALLDVTIDPDAGAQLTYDPRLSSIRFSDLAEGKSALEGEQER